MKTTSALLEWYLKCPTECWLRAAGEQPSGNPYAEWKEAQDESFRAAQVERLLTEIPTGEFVRSPTPEGLKAGNWRLAADIVVSVPALSSSVPPCILESHIHAVERVAPGGRGKAAQFVPIRFVFRNKLTTADRLIAAFDTMVLSAAINRKITAGKIIHGDDHGTLKVKATALANEVRKQLGKIAALLASPRPPDLVLNRHCAECEYQVRCRQQALDKDDLSLLANMSEKERNKLHGKGIFTVTQLSYTFRPRRRSKRLREKREKYHNSLKALAIRENKIHIVGSPELKIEGTPVYLDVEGLPDRDFYYLIGLRIGNGESAVQHSLWADTAGDECNIWRDFLSILETVENPVLIHYGSYETVFLKRMSERYGSPPGGQIVAQVLQSSVNLVSHIFAQIYFPCISNGLKDAAGTLGYSWEDTNASGLKSIAWRCQWEVLHKAVFKKWLLTYNLQDCEALDIVTNLIRQLSGQLTSDKSVQTGTVDIVHAESEKYQKKSTWKTFVSTVSGFEYINAAAHWDYQRDRIYARSGKPPRKKQPPLLKKRQQRVEQVIIWPVCRCCPTCKRQVRLKGPQVTKTVQDIIFGRRSLKLRFVKYVIQTYRCWKCRSVFGVAERFSVFRRYGWNLVAYLFYHIVEMNIPQRTATDSFNRLFNFRLRTTTVNNMKERFARYYAETSRNIFDSIVRGRLVHVDETRANVKGKTAYVWVLTNMNEVYYTLADSREGDMAQKLLSNFKGVLVSDFYTAYDSIECPQQRCLIHLMRDLNDEVLNNPFDDQLKQIVTAFGFLLKKVIETVDRYGLKNHYLKKHLTGVNRFYRELERVDWQSNVALKCRDRFKRNRDKLFTFLNYDGIPWNNNNAEHAIKAFARVRDVVGGASTEKSLGEYLTLLSVCQTCKYMGVDFLDFLRSGDKDVYLFVESCRGRRFRSDAIKRKDLSTEI